MSNDKIDTSSTGMRRVSALEQLWSNATALKGFLLTDGLEAPTAPSDVDRRVREVNLPSESMNVVRQER